MIGSQKKALEKVCLEAQGLCCLCVKGDLRWPESCVVASWRSLFSFTEIGLIHIQISHKEEKEIRLVVVTMAVLVLWSIRQHPSTTPHAFRRLHHGKNSMMQSRRTFHGASLCTPG
jgi:hypothetical protein